MSEPAAKLRLDKWLWFARFFKTRSLAAAGVAAGDIRIDGEKVVKRSISVQAGNVLTFTTGSHVRAIQIDAIGSRRGPAPEAQTLYTDLSPPEPKAQNKPPANPRFEGKGRPTKKDRRKGDLYRSQSSGATPDHLE